MTGHSEQRPSAERKEEWARGAGEVCPRPSCAILLPRAGILLGTRHWLNLSLQETTILTLVHFPWRVCDPIVGGLLPVPPMQLIVSKGALDAPGTRPRLEQLDSGC